MAWSQILLGVQDDLLALDPYVSVVLSAGGGVTQEAHKKVRILVDFDIANLFVAQRVLLK